jgi:hypothetical protein
LSTAIDNIFINSARLITSCTCPIVIRLSDHDAQFLKVINITTEVNLIPMKQRTTKVNNEAIAQFRRMLENELWKPAFRIRIHIIRGSCSIQNRSIGRRKKTG